MMKPSACLFGAAAVLAAFSASALTLTTEDGPPWNMVDAKSGAITGIAADKVRELMRRADETYTLAIYPWARAYQLALQEKDTCVFSTTRTAEREPLFKWIGPLAKSPQAVFARANDARRPGSLEELRPFVIGGYHDDATAAYLIKQGYKVESANYDVDNVGKLMRERIDFWATGEQLGLYLISRSGFKGKIVPLFTFRPTELYLACHPAMETRHVDRFNALLKDMERDGTNMAIEAKYK